MLFHYLSFVIDPINFWSSFRLFRYCHHFLRSPRVRSHWKAFYRVLPSFSIRWPFALVAHVAMFLFSSSSSSSSSSSLLILMPIVFRLGLPSDGAFVGGASFRCGRLVFFPRKRKKKWRMFRSQSVSIVSFIFNFTFDAECCESIAIATVAAAFLRLLLTTRKRRRRRSKRRRGKEMEGKKNWTHRHTHTRTHEHKKVNEWKREREKSHLFVSFSGCRRVLLSRFSSRSIMRRVLTLLL